MTVTFASRIRIVYIVINFNSEYWITDCEIHRSHSVLWVWTNCWEYGTYADFDGMMKFANHVRGHLELFTRLLGIFTRPRLPGFRNNSEKRKAGPPRNNGIFMGEKYSGRNVPNPNFPRPKCFAFCETSYIPLHMFDL